MYGVGRKVPENESSRERMFHIWYISLLGVEVRGNESSIIRFSVSGCSIVRRSFSLLGLGMGLGLAVGLYDDYQSKDY